MKEKIEKLIEEMRKEKEYYFTKYEEAEEVNDEQMMNITRGKWILLCKYITQLEDSIYEK